MDFGGSFEYPFYLTAMFEPFLLFGGIILLLHVDPVRIFHLNLEIIRILRNDEQKHT